MREGKYKFIEQIAYTKAKDMVMVSFPLRGFGDDWNTKHALIKYLDDNNCRWEYCSGSSEIEDSYEDSDHYYREDGMASGGHIAFHMTNRDFVMEFDDIKNTKILDMKYKDCIVPFKKREDKDDRLYAPEKFENNVIELEEIVKNTLSSEVSFGMYWSKRLTETRDRLEKMKTLPNPYDESEMDYNLISDRFIGNGKNDIYQRYKEVIRLQKRIHQMGTKEYKIVTSI